MGDPTRMAPLHHPTIANLAMSQDLGVTGDVKLPARYGGGVLLGASARFKGALINNGYLPSLAETLGLLQDTALLPDPRRSSQLRHQKVASVQVFNDGFNWYLVLTYTLSTAFSTTNQGGTTTLTTGSGILQLATANGLADGDVVITSRADDRSERVLPIGATRGSLRFGGEDGVTF